MICDLYFKHRVCLRELRYLSLYDKNFSSEAGGGGCGYLGVNVERIKLVSFVVELRSKGIEAFNVPVVYRDTPNIGREEAFHLANDHAALEGRCVVYESARILDGGSPLYWVFSMVGGGEERAGGVVYIDKLDGHVWSLVEYEEYMHDYCGLLI